MMRLTLTVCVGLLACSDDKQMRKPDAVRGLPDGSVVVLAEGYGGRDVVARVAPSGKTLWIRELTDVFPQNLHADAGILLTRDTIALRTARRRGEKLDSFVEGYTTAGKRRWISPLAELVRRSPSTDGLATVTGFARDNTFYEIVRVAGSDWLVALDEATGRELHRSKLPLSPQRIDIAGNRVALTELDRRVSVTRAGFEISLTREPAGCHFDGWQVTRLHDTIEVTTGSAAVHHDGIWLRECVSFRDHLGLVVEVPKPRIRNELWILRRDGSVVARHELGTSLVPDNPRFPGNGLSGANTRFVLIRSHSGVLTTEVTLFDLLEGTRVWQASWSNPPEVIRDGDRWFIVDYDSGAIASIDSNTGRLLAARRIRTRFAMSPMSAANSAGHTFWLRGSDWTNDITSQLVPLDAATLLPLDQAKADTIDMSPEPPYNAIPRR